MTRGQPNNPEERALKIAATKARCTPEDYVWHISNNEKWCAKCQSWQPIGLFSKARGRTFGLYSYCTLCHSKERKANVSLLSQKRREYRFTHQEQELAYRNSPSAKYSYYKSKATQRNYVWALTFEEFVSFWQKSCVYCGDPITTIGVDRIDNKIGYIITNCVPCCTVCNRMKKEFTVSFWVSHMKQIISFLQQTKELKCH